MNIPIAMALFVLAFFFVFMAGYVIGKWRGASHVYTHDGPEPVDVITEPPAAEVTMAERIAAQVAVIELPPITAPLAILPPASFASTPVDLLAENTALRAALARADVLRRRYLRRARAQTQRLNFMLGDVMDAHRRPTKAKLTTVMLEMPRGRLLHLVPRPVIAESRAAS